MPGPITLDGSAVFGFITENGKMMSGGGGGGGIPDAPIDGQLYGRRDGAWEDIYAAQQYQDTIFVDPAGDATKDGKNPSGPTTWANAIANAAFDTLIVLSPGTYSDGDGPGTGTTTIPASNVSIVARQGGTGSTALSSATRLSSAQALSALAFTACASMAASSTTGAWANTTLRPARPTAAPMCERTPLRGSSSIDATSKCSTIRSAARGRASRAGGL